MECPFCGYDLSGNGGGVCPECGRPVDRYTDRARAVIVEANRHACLYFRHGNPHRPARWWLPRTVERPQINPSHILLGIVSGPHGIGYHALQNCGTNLERLHDAVVARAVRCAPRDVSDGVKLPLSYYSFGIVNLARDEAFRLGFNYVGTEHLLLALCRQRFDMAVKRELAKGNVTRDRVREFVIANVARVNSPKTAGLLGSDEPATS